MRKNLPRTRNFVLQGVAVCCGVLQCVAVGASLLPPHRRRVRERICHGHEMLCCSVLQCVAVCCSVLQRVAACCSVLQWEPRCCLLVGGG